MIVVPDVFMTIFTIIITINIILAGITVFFEHRKPASTWAWLMVITFIPVIGFLCYLIFGKETKKEKIFKMKAENDYETYYGYMNTMEKYSVMIKAQKKAIEERIDILGSKNLNDFAYLHINSGNCITYDNSVKTYSDGNDKFNDLIDDIRNAKSFIHMEYYILRGDSLGKMIVDELTKRAEDGLEVRLLYDAMGNCFLPKDFFKKFEEAGGKTGKFLSTSHSRPCGL